MNIVFLLQVVFPIFPMLALFDYKTTLSQYSYAAKDVGDLITSGCLTDLQDFDIKPAVAGYQDMIDNVQG